MTSTVIATDGATANNQDAKDRQAGLGIVVEVDGDVVHSKSLHLGVGEHYTCNVAEYAAAVHGAEWVEEHLQPDTGQLRFMTDSQLLVKQARGEWGVNAERLKPWHSELANRLQELGDPEIVRVSDDESQLVNRADSLAKEGRSQPRLNGLLSEQAIPWPRALYATRWDTITQAETVEEAETAIRPIVEALIMADEGNNLGVRPRALLHDLANEVPLSEKEVFEMYRGIRREVFNEE